MITFEELVSIFEIPEHIIELGNKTDSKSLVYIWVFKNADPTKVRGVIDRIADVFGVEIKEFSDAYEFYLNWLDYYVTREVIDEKLFEKLAYFTKANHTVSIFHSSMGSKTSTKNSVTLLSSILARVKLNRNNDGCIGCVVRSLRDNPEILIECHKNLPWVVEALCNNMPFVMNIITVFGERLGDLYDPLMIEVAKTNRLFSLFDAKIITLDYWVDYSEDEEFELIVSSDSMVFKKLVLSRNHRLKQLAKEGKLANMFITCSLYDDEFNETIKTKDFYKDLASVYINNETDLTIYNTLTNVY